MGLLSAIDDLVVLNYCRRASLAGLQQRLTAVLFFVRCRNEKRVSAMKGTIIIVLPDTNVLIVTLVARGLCHQMLLGEQIPPQRSFDRDRRIGLLNSALRFS